MKKHFFTDNQSMDILKQAKSETAVTEVCREHGISSAVSINSIRAIVALILACCPV